MTFGSNFYNIAQVAQDDANQLVERAVDANLKQPGADHKAVDTALSGEQIERLNAMTRPEAIYLAWMVERQNSNR